MEIDRKETGETGMYKGGSSCLWRTVRGEQQLLGVPKHAFNSLWIYNETQRFVEGHNLGICE